MDREGTKSGRSDLLASEREIDGEADQIDVAANRGKKALQWGDYDGRDGLEAVRVFGSEAGEDGNGVAWVG